MRNLKTICNMFAAQSNEQYKRYVNQLGDVPYLSYFQWIAAESLNGRYSRFAKAMARIGIIAVFYTSGKQIKG